MVNPIHPLNGRVLAVRHTQRIYGLRMILAEHPDGGTLTLPGVTPAGPPPGSETRFDARRLVALADMIALLMTKQ